MLRILFALLLLAACESAPAPAALGPEYHEQLLMVDGAACRGPDGVASPHWNGDVWTFPAGGAVRCPLALEWQDYVTSFEVYGVLGPGPAMTTACLQVRELTSPGIPPQEFNPCASQVAAQPGGLLQHWNAPSPGVGFSEDLAGSIVIHGAPGDLFYGLIYYVQRLR